MELADGMNEEDMAIESRLVGILCLGSMGEDTPEAVGDQSR